MRQPARSHTTCGMRCVVLSICAFLLVPAVAAAQVRAPGVADASPRAQPGFAALVVPAAAGAAAGAYAGYHLGLAGDEAGAVPTAAAAAAAGATFAMLLRSNGSLSRACAFTGGAYGVLGGVAGALLAGQLARTRDAALLTGYALGHGIVASGFATACEPRHRRSQ